MPVVERYSASRRVVGKFEPLERDRELDDTSKELETLRTFLQLNDLYEPATACERFRKINYTVNRLCCEISNTFRSYTTWPDILRSGLSPNTAVFTQLSDIPELAIRFGLQSIICQQLCKFVFDRFHPMMGPELNEMLQNSYSHIQQQESQRIAAKWRSSTFWAYHQLHIRRLEGWMIDTVDRIGKEWKAFLSAEIVERSKDDLRELVQLAFKWKQSVQIQCLSLDFHPIANPALAKSLADLLPSDQLSDNRSTDSQWSPGRSTVQPPSESDNKSLSDSTNRVSVSVCNDLTIRVEHFDGKIMNAVYENVKGKPIVVGLGLQSSEKGKVAWQLEVPVVISRA